MLDAPRDAPSVTADGTPAGFAPIAGVVVREARHILTRSGSMTELCSLQWPEVAQAPAQVNWVVLQPGGVTDWHRHHDQVDHIFAVVGALRLSLYDDRDGSSTAGVVNTLRLGVLTPKLVIIPPGVWHGFRNETLEPAAYINYFNRPYSHEQPDNWRLPHDSPLIPCRL